MSDHYDSETGEVFAGAPSPSAARSSSRKRRDRVWETRPDGTRHQRSLNPAEQAEANAARPTRLETGTWRYDVGPDGKRFRRPLSAEEIQAKAEAKRLFASRREEERTMLEQLIPILRAPDDPPPQTEHAIPLDARTSAGIELLSLPRPNGSRLRLVGKFYDGEGPSGHRAISYVNSCILFTNPISGLQYRTRGTMFERTELRAVAEVLLRRADELDRLESESP